jgi:adenosylhomocysteine nucleosidase
VSDKGVDFVIAATGLRAEARIAARSGGVRAIEGGGDTVRLEKLVRQLAAQGGVAIISFGMAAGLVPQCSAGACLIGREVVYGGSSYPADPAWTANIKKIIGRADLVRIAGTDRPLTRPSEKEGLHQASGAAAADMESHVVARIAAELALPFAVLRVIADPVERALPPAAPAGMRTDGGIDVGTVLASLAKSPRQLPGLIRLATDAGRARSVLLRCSDVLGPRLGFRDLS